MAEVAKGPSKNELKKMAKKAEKAAKKQAAKQGGIPPAGGGGKGAPAAATQKEAPPLPPAPKLLLANAKDGCPATLKAVWAAQHYKVELVMGKKKDLPASYGSKPALIYGNDIVLGGGGNAMCKAIALMGGASYDFEADEWCEIERIWDKAQAQEIVKRCTGKDGVVSEEKKSGHFGGRQSRREEASRSR